MENVNEPKHGSNKQNENQPEKLSGDISGSATGSQRLFDRLRQKGKAGLITGVKAQVQKSVNSVRSPGGQQLLDSLRDVVDCYIEEGATTISAAEATKTLRAAELAYHKTPNYIGTLLGEGGLFLSVVWIDGRKRYVITKDEKLRQQLLAECGKTTNVDEAE